MTKLLSTVALTLILASSAMAADQVVYNAKNGTVITFNHRAHQAKFECKVCHGSGAPSKIVIEGKKAHELCLSCHKQMKTDKASGRCGECHKK